MADRPLLARSGAWLMVLSLAVACGSPPPAACLSRDDCTGSQVCVGGRCVAQTIDAGESDAGATDDVGTPEDAAETPDAYVEDDAFVPSDAAVAPASGRLFVLTGDTRTILSYRIDLDGAPRATGALDAHQQGRALVARADGRGLYLWAVDDSGSGSLEAFAITSGVASGLGYTLDIGGSSLPDGAPIAVSPGDVSLYAGFVMGDAAIVQAAAGEGTFTTFVPFSVTVDGAAAGIAVGIDSDRLFVSIPSRDAVIGYAIGADGRIGTPVTTAVTCPTPGAVIAHPSRALIYVPCAGSSELLVMQYAGGALFTLESHSMVGAGGSLVLDRSGRWLLSYAPSSDAMTAIDLFEVMDDGRLRGAGSATVESPTAIGFDASGSRIYVVRFASLDEYAFHGDPFIVTRRTSTELDSIDGRAIATTL
jgi:hypothetical protein